MNVTVRYHGIIGDMLRRKTQQGEKSGDTTVIDLVAGDHGDDESAKPILKLTHGFIDGKQADRSVLLGDSAEVIFMRPIAGG